MLYKELTTIYKTFEKSLALKIKSRMLYLRLLDLNKKI